MRRLIPAIFVVALLLDACFRQASAQDARALNQLSSEAVQCAAFYSIMARTMELEGVPAVEQRFKKLNEKALSHALVYAKEAGLMQETVGARFKMALENMMKRTGKQASNISILMADYKDLCLEATNNPTARIQYWSGR